MFYIKLFCFYFLCKSKQTKYENTVMRVKDLRQNAYHLGGEAVLGRNLEDLVEVVKTEVVFLIRS